MGFYWRFEKAIRAAESRLDSTVGVTGAIYALRRELFELIPTDTLLDDVLVPLRMVRRGYRVVFEPGAKAYEPAPRQAAGELARKVRTIAGTFQLFARERWLLDPWRNRLFLQTVSHKGLRLLTPLLLAVAFAADLLLARDDPWHRWTLAAQVLFYLAALCGFVLRDAGRRFPLVAVPYVFCLLAWATVLAFVRFLRGRQPVTWDRVAPAPGAP